ncbi:MAG: hypothetical protein WC375_07770 [Methanomassiliicoccales archaeon]|jgi:hypothetical protein
MSLISPLLPFDGIPYDESDPPTLTADDIPKELDIFFRTESAFLPEGKTFGDLTEKEIGELKAKYRFDPMKPGIYQAISGLGKMI